LSVRFLQPFEVVIDHHHVVLGIAKVCAEMSPGCARAKDDYPHDGSTPDLYAMPANCFVLVLRLLNKCPMYTYLWNDAPGSAIRVDPFRWVVV